MSEQINSVPTQFYELPSKGLLYPANHPLAKSKGKIELRYITAAEEDIITNEHYINEGVVYDKLIKAIIVDKEIDYLDLVLADFNSLLYPIKVLSYGAITTFEHEGETYEVDISKFENKKLNEADYPNNNHFEFQLPNSDNLITFKLPTLRIDREIDKELEVLKEKEPNKKFRNVVFFNHVITSINGSSAKKDIEGFIYTLLSADARAIRARIVELTPQVIAEFTDKGGRRLVVPPDAFLLYPYNAL